MSTGSASSLLASNASVTYDVKFFLHAEMR